MMKFFDWWIEFSLHTWLRCLGYIVAGWFVVAVASLTQIPTLYAVGVWGWWASIVGLLTFPMTLFVAALVVKVLRDPSVLYDGDEYD